MEAEM